MQCHALLYLKVKQATATLQLLKDQHVMVIILAVTGVAVLLLLLETAVPYLRGSTTLERDMENPDGETVCT